MLIAIGGSKRAGGATGQFDKRSDQTGEGGGVRGEGGGGLI